ncbi:MAG: hypothetical protein GY830_10275 [Bacteroidetes bacterium]|nr:hypothetical protein [Bacteroidota bacterium]
MYKIFFLWLIIVCCNVPDFNENNDLNKRSRNNISDLNQVTNEKNDFNTNTISDSNIPIKNDSFRSQQNTQNSNNPTDIILETTEGASILNSNKPDYNSMPPESLQIANNSTIDNILDIIEDKIESNNTNSDSMENSNNSNDDSLEKSDLSLIEDIVEAKNTNSGTIENLNNSINDNARTNIPIRPIDGESLNSNNSAEDNISGLPQNFIENNDSNLDDNADLNLNIVKFLTQEEKELYTSGTLEELQNSLDYLVKYEKMEVEREDLEKNVNHILHNIANPLFLTKYKRIFKYYYDKRKFQNLILRYAPIKLKEEYYNNIFVTSNINIKLKIVGLFGLETVFNSLLLQYNLSIQETFDYKKYLLETNIDPKCLKIILDSIIENNDKLPIDLYYDLIKKYTIAKLNENIEFIIENKSKYFIEGENDKQKLLDLCSYAANTNNLKVLKILLIEIDKIDKNTKFEQDEDGYNLIQSALINNSIKTFKYLTKNLGSIKIKKLLNEPFIEYEEEEDGNEKEIEFTCFTYSACQGYYFLFDTMLEYIKIDKNEQGMRALVYLLQNLENADSEAEIKRIYESIINLLPKLSKSKLNEKKFNDSSIIDLIKKKNRETEIKPIQEKYFKKLLKEISR